MNKNTNAPTSKIQIRDFRSHSKASERYVDVIFNYEDGFTWTGSIPIEYRRTGIDLQSDEEVSSYLPEIYEHFHPTTWKKWGTEQENFWADKSGAAVTKAFFDVLLGFEWRCVACKCPPNPNPARRIQDLKEFGYTIATDTARFCSNCDTKRTHLLLVPIPRGGISGYETWSPKKRKHIIKLLENYDAFEGKKGNPNALLPDHKFPEIRWNEETRRETLENLTDAEIHNDFQLLTNQRNLQKREVCRKCYQTGERGKPFGIEFFIKGGPIWPEDLPKDGKEAEAGCLGCGWYDLEAWRKALNKDIKTVKDDS